MAKYVDGFVLVIPKDKIEDYNKMAEDGREAWMRHGALSYFECMEDDIVPVEMGGMKQLGFKALAKTNDDETVWFSFITYNSKEHRDEVTEKVMAEFSEKYKDQEDFQMPYDMNRMAQGGFSVVVEG